MSERRRMMMGTKVPELITDGLQFWFDGKNNLQGGGYSIYSTKWYAYMSQNGILDNLPLNKEGSPVWQANGGFTANGAAKNGYGSGSARQSLPTRFGSVGDFTIICCLRQNDTVGEHGFFVGGWRVFMFGVQENKLFMMDGTSSGWKARNFSNTISETLKFAALSRNGNTFTFYLNGKPWGSFTYSSFNNFIGSGTDYNFELGTYEFANSVDAFYGALMYGRCLSSKEINDMNVYLIHRYGL